VEPVNAANPFGPLLDGFIKAKGFLARLPGELSGQSRPDTTHLFALDEYDFAYALDLDVTKPELEITSTDEVIFFIIRHEKHTGKRRPDSSSAKITGLCLKKVNEKHCYQRVGRVALDIVGPQEEGVPGGIMYLEACYRILNAKEETITIIQFEPRIAFNKDDICKSFKCLVFAVFIIVKGAKLQPKIDLPSARYFLNAS
jgi:hypothetical protein